MIRDLHHQGLNISQISRTTGYHRNTVRKYLAAQTLPAPASRGPRQSKLDPFKAYIQQRITEYPLSAARIHREIQEMGFDGKYTIVKEYIRTIRPRETVQAVLELQDNQMTVRVGTEAICSHTIVPGHARVIREKQHFSGLLAEAMQCNARCRKTSHPLFSIAAPQVEQRPLSVYDRFSGEVRR